MLCNQKIMDRDHPTKIKLLVKPFILIFIAKYKNKAKTKH